MLDLGLSFLGSVARDPNALAIVDGDVRLTYAQWYRRISAMVAGFDAMGLKPGDHLVTALQNRWEAATLHWACQFAGIVITPVNWRSTASEIDFYLDDAEAKADRLRGPRRPRPLRHRPRRKNCRGSRSMRRRRAEIAFAALVGRAAPDAAARVDAEAWSVMLYTSGTTAQPKGVPRRQRAERAAALAHVAQNLYAHGERTLGVMPLYHTMGVRSLLAMSLIGGAFVCLRRFDVGEALRLIAAERVTNLYLVPTLYHDLVHHPLFAGSDVSSVRKLGFAGAPMTDGLLEKLQSAFKPDLFVNHYGSSEVYTFTIDQNAPAKPGSAGRAGINQMVRVVKLGAQSVDEIAAIGEEGEIIALLAGDESFEGYWRRPDADAKALREGWYFTGDTGFFDARRRYFRHRPGRRHDHHRRRERLAGRDRNPACRCMPPSRKSRSSACRTSAGARSSPPSSSAARRSRPRSSTHSAAVPGSPISSGRGAMFSSRKFRNRRSENCCAASSSPANIMSNPLRLTQGTAA